MDLKKLSKLTHLPIQKIYSIKRGLKKNPQFQINHLRQFKTYKRAMSKEQIGYVFELITNSNGKKIKTSKI